MSELPVKNSVYNVIYRLLNVLFPLITVTYVSRVLMADGVGRISYAQNIVSYFTMLAPLGLLSYGTREISKSRSQGCSKVYSELFAINSISTVVFSFSYILLINLVPKFNNDNTLYYIVGITLYFNIFNIDWLYQGLEEYRYIAFRSVVIKSICLVLIFAFVKKKDDYLIYALITAFGTTGNYFLNIIGAHKRVKLSFSNLSIKRHLLPIILLAASSIAIELYNAIGVSILGFIGTDTEVGLFSNANKIVRLIQSVISAIGAVLLPRLSYYYMIEDQKNIDMLVNKALKVMMIVTLPASVGLVCVADELVPVFFGDSFKCAIPTLKILAVVLPVLVLNVLYGIQVLIASGHDRKYLYTVCLGAGVSLITNPPLIYLLAQNGAAIASFLSELSVAICTIIFAKKYVKFDGDLICYVQIALASMCMGGCVYIIDFLPLDLSDFFSLFLSLFLGVFSYIIVLYLLKNKVFLDLIKLLHINRKGKN